MEQIEEKYLILHLYFLSSVESNQNAEQQEKAD